jgi:hypothetical protein
MKRYRVGMLLITTGVAAAVVLVSCLKPVDTCEGINRPDAPLVLRMKSPDLRACKVSTAGPGCTNVVCGSPLADGGCACWQGRVWGKEAGKLCTVSFNCSDGLRSTPISQETSCEFPLSLAFRACSDCDRQSSLRALAHASQDRRGRFAPLGPRAQVADILLARHVR